MAEAFVKIANVEKIFDTGKQQVHALDDVSIDVAEGEFISILGPSGCGKSTLLMLTAGLLSRTGGRIEVDGHLITGPYTDLGIVFQQDVLLDWRTVVDNVLLQCEFRGLRRSKYRDVALDLLDQVGLKGFEDTRPYELSGGMRQRAAICRALVHDPPLLLMDEPFGALDALTRDQMNLDLMQLWDTKRKTVMFITHSIDEAVFMSDRIEIMSPRPGRILEDITIDLARPRELSVRETPAFHEYSNHIRRLFAQLGLFNVGHDRRQDDHVHH